MLNNLVHKYNYKYFELQILFIFYKNITIFLFMKIGKIHIKFNFYSKEDEMVTNQVTKSDSTEYGTLTFDDNGKLVDWFVDKDLLKKVCDQADKERYGDEQADTFNFCWEHSIKNKSDYPDGGEKLINRVNESWFNELIKLSNEKDTSLILYSWDNEIRN
jgi:hypothetical protein